MDSRRRLDIKQEIHEVEVSIVALYIVIEVNFIDGRCIRNLLIQTHGL